MLRTRKYMYFGLVGLFSLLPIAGQAQAALNLVESFTVGDGFSDFFVGLGYDPVGERVYVYQQFDTVIRRFTPSGAADGMISLTGITAPSTRFDLDFATVAFNLGGGVAPANSLLVFNGQTANEIYSIDKTTGAVHSGIAYGPASQMVGGAYHQLSDSLYATNINFGDFVTQVLPTSAAVIPKFSPAPFDVFFGDLEFDQSTGNLLLVSSQHSFIRVFDSNGLFIEDINVAPFGIGIGAGGPGLSGIALDDSTGDIWLLQRNGRVVHLAQETAAVPEPSSLALLGFGSIIGLGWWARRPKVRLLNVSWRRSPV